MVHQQDPTYAAAAHGVNAANVEPVADALLREGLRPTVERVRERLGRGSPNTITPLLDAWWKGLSRRLSGGPDFLERIPADAFHAIESIWVRLRIEAERRAGRALAPEREEVAQQARQVELRSEVLTLREAEYQEQLRRRASDIERLETALGEVGRVRGLAEARAASAERRIRVLEEEVAALHARIAHALAGVVRKKMAQHSTPRKKTARQKITARGARKRPTRK